MPRLTPGAILSSLSDALERIRTARSPAAATSQGAALQDPGQPQIPSGIQPPNTRFEFPYGINVVSTPRQYETISFKTLRSLADNYYLVRLIIETRKDQMCVLPWTIKSRDDKKSKDDRAKAFIEMFRKPDGRTHWSNWLRMLLEEALVIDAVAVYPIKTVGRGIAGFDLLDGSLISQVVDVTGRTPQPPSVAYQQRIRGHVVADYTTDDLAYYMRNPRVSKLYGMSPIEQIVSIVNVGLLRVTSQTQFFSEGTVPDALASVPKEWTSKQIIEFQNLWDAMTNDTGVRRKLRFIPDGVRYQPTKEPIIKDAFDEWLARIACFAFGIEATPFISQVNRSVAETVRQQAKEEGQEPWMQFVANVVDDLLARLGADDLEFRWELKNDVDPKVQAEVFSSYLTNKVMTINEVRAELGKDPVAWGDAPVEEKQPEPGKDGKPTKAGENQDDDDDPDPDPDKSAVQKGGGGLKKPGARHRLIRHERAKLAKSVAEAFAGIAKAIATKVEQSTVEKAEQSPGPVDPDALMNEVEEWWLAMIPDVEASIANVATESALAMLAVALPEPGDAMFKAVRARSTAWAQNRAAELVGMKWVDGVLVPNPNAYWQITETTREGLRALVREATETGLTSAQLANKIRDAYWFSKERADIVARTEVGYADAGGAHEGATEAGVKFKRWQTSQDDKVSPQCVDDGAAGLIGMKRKFPSGSLHPPGHPRCRCNLLYFFKKDDDE